MRFSEAVRLLSEANIPDPKYDARELFLRVGGCDADALIFSDPDISSSELVSAVRRRSKREPLQYIIGEVGFYREVYEVTPDVLIPRQDTEHLVDFAVKNIPEGKSFLDLCTGSGCIAISTLKNTDSTSSFALDISESAIKIAKRNADKNRVSHRVEFIRADALTERVEGKFYAILSNPPYVTRSAYEKLEAEIYFEPEEAFVADGNGLIFYKRILELYRNSLEEGGFFAFEIGYDQGDSIRQLAKEFGLSAEIIKDYSLNDRVAVLK